MVAYLIFKHLVQILYGHIFPKLTELTQLETWTTTGHFKINLNWLFPFQCVLLYLCFAFNWIACFVWLAFKSFRCLYPIVFVLYFGFAEDYTNDMNCESFYNFGRFSLHLFHILFFHTIFSFTSPCWQANVIACCLYFITFSMFLRKRKKENHLEPTENVHLETNGK